MAAFTRLATSALRLNNGLFRPNAVRVVGISTSKKNKDTITIADTLVEQEKSKTETAVPTSKNWISWGFSYESETEDNTLMHLSFLFGVTLCLVTTGFYWAYLPDYRMVNWAQREAYLELRRREELGLPLIDPNLIDAEKMDLPSDEDLGSTEIVI
ncbi:NADH dehydrogenase [ubiquinone] 1 beta subcomplex subunit 11, mitochondrial [Procambarus clarkii]|uniref:NADH dehydrogenase [ubiquinone] 1 beta subcomplex subunit 11, mitochondrial n=1 Tax=Procambarus clarkii TaxID=6728 RepID=UPI001E6706A7|nr:NADH dehydrogenase [ubiquinone] 1 beta subcomplex subunit 11, mitochondrial-like [Procambarus clarkii]